MKSGVFVENGAAEELVAAPQNPYTKKLLDAIPHLGSWDGSPDPAPYGTAPREVAV